MDTMDAWSVFLNTGNILDYLRYSAIRDSTEYFENEKNKNDGKTGDEPDPSQRQFR